MTNPFVVEFDKKRIFGLDIVRALAIFFVILGHSADLLTPKIKVLFALFPFPDGVAVFFVLSGFLIGGILIKTFESEEASLSTMFTFWKKRWLRTLPLYFLMLIILTCLSILFVPQFKASQVLKYFIFCQNFNTPHPIFFVEAWSLSVEEWFYLFTPSLIFILIGFFKITPKRAILVTIIAGILFTIIFRYYRYLNISVTGEQVWAAFFRGQVITRLDSLMFGVVGAYIAFYHPLSWVKFKTPLFVAGLLAIIFNYLLSKWVFANSAFYFCNLSFICTSVSVILLFPFLSQLKSGKGYAYKIITFTSLISYSLYLTHASLMIQWIIIKISVLQAGSKLTISVRYALYWILTIIVSTCLYKFFELPFMALRDRISINKKRDIRLLNEV